MLLRNFFRNKFFIWLLIITILIGGIAVFLNMSSNQTGIMENSVSIVITPVQKLFSGIGYSVSNFFRYFSNIDMLREENSVLAAENAELEQKIRELEGFEVENERLRKMLGLKETNPELDIVSAEIIAKDPSNWYSTFTIDKGTSSGLALNQVVMTTDKYLVGRICDIGTTWAKVITITDPEHSVGSILSRSRDLCVVNGDTELNLSGYCKMSYISKNTNIIIGDYVETSGLGGIYPKGILIGKVIEIKPELQSISQYAVIEPAANLDKITEVFVIKTEVAEIP